MTPDTFFIIFIRDYESDSQFMYGPYAKVEHANIAALDYFQILLNLNKIFHNNWEGEVSECILGQGTVEVLNVRGNFLPPR